MQLRAAPLIVRSATDLIADRQEVVLFLHDFSFRPAAQVLAEITGGDGSMAGMAWVRRPLRPMRWWAWRCRVWRWT